VDLVLVRRRMEGEQPGRRRQLEPARPTGPVNLKEQDVTDPMEIN
jgi:hypothetical protein